MRLIFLAKHALIGIIKIKARLSQTVTNIMKPSSKYLSKANRLYERDLWGIDEFFNKSMEIQEKY